MFRSRSVPRSNVPLMQAESIVKEYTIGANRWKRYGLPLNEDGNLLLAYIVVKLPQETHAIPAIVDQYNPGHQ